MLGNDKGKDEGTVYWNPEVQAFTPLTTSWLSRSNRRKFFFLAKV